MRLEHEFTVPVPVDTAWPVLLDIERIAPCMPGATLTRVDGRDFEGKVRVKVGPITVTYNGSASFTEVDESARRAVIAARGKEARGTGTADATITAQLHGDGESTRVTVETDLAITGRPAQFGRGVMNDVGGKLLGRFASCLSEQLAAEPPAEPTEPTAEPAAEQPEPATAEVVAAGPAAAKEPSAPPVPARPAAGPRYRPADEPIDLLGTATGPVLRRYGPALAALLALVLLVRMFRRRRHT